MVRRIEVCHIFYLALVEVNFLKLYAVISRTDQFESAGRDVYVYGFYMGKLRDLLGPLPNRVVPNSIVRY